MTKIIESMLQMRIDTLQFEVGRVIRERDEARRERDEARARALEEAAKFIEDGQSKAYSESVNGAFKVMAFAIRQLKDRAP